jgi:hypothetical protein
MVPGKCLLVFGLKERFRGGVRADFRPFCTEGMVPRRGTWQVFARFGLKEVLGRGAWHVFARSGFKEGFEGVVPSRFSLVLN